MSNKQNLYKHKIWPTHTTYEEAYAILESTKQEESGQPGVFWLESQLGRVCSLSTLNGNRIWYIDEATGLPVAGIFSLRKNGLTKEQVGTWRDQTKTSLLRALWRLNE